MRHSHQLQFFIAMQVKVMIPSLFAIIVVIDDSEKLLIVPTCGTQEYVVQIEACRLIIL